MASTACPNLSTPFQSGLIFNALNLFKMDGKDKGKSKK